MDLFRKKDIQDFKNTPSHLIQCLTAFDLVFMGVGAIIGAGVFVITGIVAANLAGPGVILSYIIAGFACAFAALSYAELAASIGGCGSAYGYAYAAFGEFFAWIVGWDLLLEYAFSVSAVSVGWSGYAKDLLLALHIHIHDDFVRCPQAGGIINLLAVGIILFLTTLLLVGVKYSSRVNNIMVAIKLLVIVLFIAIASTEIQVANWQPFLPFGWSGVIKGASLIFFAYIGFDAVSTAAEEAINPQRDLPIGIIGSLLICTTIYITVAGLLTGIAHYSSLDVSSPVSRSLLVLGYKAAAGTIGVGVIAGLSTVMLVLFYGLTRVFFAMSRDGLLPRSFSHVNHTTKTPERIILFCGIIIASISAFMPIGELAELVNVGTLFAFMVACGGVLYLRYTKPDMSRPYKTPGMPYVPILGVLSCFYLLINLPWLTIARFVVWMLLGVVVYFSYSYKHSFLSAASKD